MFLFLLFDAHSSLLVFIVLFCFFFGFVSQTRVYICLDVVSSRVFISHHVEFVESVFPFVSLTSKSSPVLTEESSSSASPSATLVPVFKRPLSLEPQ